jgi:hypothetical protein
MSPIHTPSPHHPDRPAAIVATDPRRPPYHRRVAVIRTDGSRFSLCLPPLAHPAER